MTLVTVAGVCRRVLGNDSGAGRFRGGLTTTSLTGVSLAAAALPPCGGEGAEAGVSGVVFCTLGRVTLVLRPPEVVQGVLEPGKLGRPEALSLGVCFLEPRG